VKETAQETTDTITKTTKKIVREITFAGDGLKKVVLVVPFEDQSGQAREAFLKTFHEDIIAYLKNNCEDLIVTQSGALTQLPKLASGQTDNYALAVIGRQLGLNAIVAGSMNNIRPKDEEKGIFWTKDTHYLIEILVRGAVYDTRTATKTLDEGFTENVEIDETQYRIIQEQGVYNEPQINEALNRFVSEMGDRICEVLEVQNWTGFVTAVEPEKITISTGGPVGLEEGDILQVFDSGMVLEGVDGQRFIIPGRKNAEIEIVAVTEKQAEAARPAGQEIKIGDLVRKK
jgi:TolB-like protein